MDTFSCRLLVIVIVFGVCEITGVEHRKGQACEWVICNRRHQDESFSCDNSYIFVENVTDFWGKSVHVAYQNVKQMCMGSKSCNPSRMCRGTHMEHLRVRYVCVNAISINKQCEWPVETIWRREGHIQSPEYPAAFPPQSCSWRVTAPEDRFVHISVHDVSFLTSPEKCDSGLNITYQECATGHVMSRMYCGLFGRRSEVIACGSVSIQLAAERKNIGVRFWLSFEVTSSPTAAVQSPLLKFVDRCTQGEATSSSVLSSQVLRLPVLRPLDPLLDMATTTYHNPTTTSPHPGAISTANSPAQTQEITTKVIIIVVSTIGGVLLLAIILAVIFLKRPKVERVEHVYAVPTPCDASPTNPTSSAIPVLHERPMLRECYSEVADAIPNRLHITPASPGYAEVEDICKGDNCRWDPHKFTFGPTIRPVPPSELPFSKTPPNISTFSRANPHGKSFTGGSSMRTFLDTPGHVRTLSDTPLPYMTRIPTGSSFRDPSKTDYEDIVIDTDEQSPCFVQNDQKYLLQSRLCRAFAAAKKPQQGADDSDVKQDPEGLSVTRGRENGDVKQPKGRADLTSHKGTFAPEGLYATSSVLGDTKVLGHRKQKSFGGSSPLTNARLYENQSSKSLAGNSPFSSTRLYENQNSKSPVGSPLAKTRLYENQSSIR